MTRLTTALGITCALLLAGPAGAQEATNLRDLLTRVREGNRAQQEEDAKREAAFRANKSGQASLLAKARADRAAAEAAVEALETEFAEYESTIPKLEEDLAQRLGTLGELFGVVRQVAGDTLAYVDQSIVSAQLTDRQPFLTELSASKELPSVEDLEKLWFALQEEMTESGRIIRFPATIVGADGSPREATVVRVGAFNAVADGNYLDWEPETDQLVELARQPARRYRSTTSDLAAATDGLTGFALDPSRGVILGLLIDSPSLGERVRQGGIVGYVIIALGIAGLAVAGQRLQHLSGVGRKVKAQMGSQTVSSDNPLGRVLSVRDELAQTDVETLELKLDEAILREAPPLERGNTLVRVISVASPLLGLLGTVTGMIRVFQSITLHGTGDPSLMAGGISQALVTTVLGLVVAIPLLLLHSILAGRSQGLVEVLEEQAAGIVARHAEARSGGTGAVAG